MICAVPSGQRDQRRARARRRARGADDGQAGDVVAHRQIVAAAEIVRRHRHVFVTAAATCPPPPPLSPATWKLQPATASKAKTTYFMCSSMRYHLGVLGAIIGQPLSTRSSVARDTKRIAARSRARARRFEELRAKTLRRPESA